MASLTPHVTNALSVNICLKLFPSFKSKIQLNMKKNHKPRQDTKKNTQHWNARKCNRTSAQWCVKQHISLPSQPQKQSAAGSACNTSAPAISSFLVNTDKPHPHQWPQYCPCQQGDKLKILASAENTAASSGPHPISIKVNSSKNRPEVSGMMSQCPTCGRATLAHQHHKQGQHCSPSFLSP